jgi:hypothetical protein
LLHHFDDFYSQNIDCFYHKKNKLILKGAKHTPFLSDCFYHTKTPFLPNCFFYHTKKTRNHIAPSLWWFLFPEYRLFYHKKKTNWF